MADNRKAEVLSRQLNPNPVKASGYLEKLAEMLRGFSEYKDANTPRNTRPAVSPATVFNEGLINPNQYNEPAANRFKDSAFGLLGVVPGVGDAASTVESADLFNRGEKFAGSMAALGALPFVPALGGIIKQSGAIPKKGLAQILGDRKIVSGLNVLPENELWDAGGLLKQNMDIGVRPLDDGTFLGRVMPQWGSKTKDFYAIGDDPVELANNLLNRTAKSDKAIQTASKAKESKSVVGQLKKEFGDVFDFGRSTQSKSEYITHAPSGTKIRISDHDLPLHYEQPNVDLRTWMSDEEKLAAIKKAIYGE